VSIERNTLVDQNVLFVLIKTTTLTASICRDETKEGTKTIVANDKTDLSSASQTIVSKEGRNLDLSNDRFIIPKVTDLVLVFILCYQRLYYQEKKYQTFDCKEMIELSNPWITQRTEEQKAVVILSTSSS
jgi:hypothetical protein